MSAASVSISDRKNIPVIKIKVRITPPLAGFVIIHSPEFLFSIKHKRMFEKITNNRFGFLSRKIEGCFWCKSAKFFPLFGKNYL